MSNRLRDENKRLREDNDSLNNNILKLREELRNKENASQQVREEHQHLSTSYRPPESAKLSQEPTSSYQGYKTHYQYDFRGPSATDKKADAEPSQELTASAMKAKVDAALSKDDRPAPNDEERFKSTYLKEMEGATLQSIDHADPI